MKLLVDMNLSPRWVPALQAAGVEALHWSTVGAPTTPDEDVLKWAVLNGCAVLTHDLDYGAILASSGAATPSVIQIRSQDIRPEVMAVRVATTVIELAQALADGAVVSIEPARERVRVLPLRSEPPA